MKFVYFKNILSYLATFLTVCLCGLSATAQNNAISVESFKHNPDDLTAMNESRLDQNNQKCALIIVSNVDGGGYRFGFKNAFYEVEEKMRDGKLVYLVYVQEGAKSISISHNDPGIQPLENYYFPQAIKRASTYEMKLGQVIRTQEQGKQMLEFKVSPTNATVEVNGDFWPVRDGYASKVVPFGSYNYRVIAVDCHPEAGSVMVRSPEKQTVDIVLKPNYGWLSINQVPEMKGATIYVDGLTIDDINQVKLKSGTHVVQIHAELYKPFTNTVQIRDNEVYTLYPRFEPNFTNVTFEVADGVDVIVDGAMKGRGKTIVPLTEGTYIVETRKEGHRPQQRQISVSDISHPLNFVLQSPTPIYGGLEISSTPRDASVKVDGVERGTTPLYVNNLLVGTHDVSISKSGYQTYNVRPMIKENEDVTIDAKLNYSAYENNKPASKPQKSITRRPKDNSNFKFKKNDFFFELGLGCYSYRDEYYYDYYGEGNFTYALIPLVIGGHIANIDIEGYANFTDPIQFGVRSGYRFSFASRFAVTPLIGWGTRPVDDYWGEVETNSSFTFGSRLEYKFSRRCGLSLMGEYCLGDYSDGWNIYLSFSLTL